MAGTFAALAGGATAWALSLFNSPKFFLQTSLGLSNIDVEADLGPRLSTEAAIYLPGSNGFETATDRWIPWRNPGFDVVVEVATEEDVGETVRYANDLGKPFLAVSGQHGGTSALGDVEDGVGIWMWQMRDVKIAEDGKSARIGGGIRSKELIDKLWESGKMAVTGCCECTGNTAVMLGGGHGWLQGQYGLMVDNLLSARLVLANGTAVSVSDTENADLFWALRGAGHNFGIVTSFEYKIYDHTPENENWAIETFVFTRDKLEAVFEEANKQLEERPIELTQMSLFMRVPDVEADNPVILFFLFFQGTSIPSIYTKPFIALAPASHTQTVADLPGIAPHIGFSNDSPACQHGTTYQRFPLGAVNYSISGISEAFEILASLPHKLNQSMMILEGYSMKAVQAVPGDETAVPDRYNNLLIAPFIVHEPDGSESLDAEAARYGRQMRDAIVEGNGRPLDAYVNYAYGDEGLEAVYGREAWRLEKLRELKKAWDPEGRFGFYNPIK